MNLDIYTRLFSFDGAIPYFFSYQFIQAADWLGYMTFGDEHFWISYMQTASLERAGREGVALYQDAERYVEFRAGLYQANEQIRAATTDIRENQTITQEQLEHYLGLLNQYRWHYTRTEFFFTDLAFTKRDEITVIRDNFATFEPLKLDGRRFLNEIFLYPDSCLNQIFTVLGSQYRLLSTDLHSYSPHELIELFADKKVAEEEVRNRGCYLLRMTPDGIESFSGKVAKEKIQEFQKNPDTAQSVQGTVAYPGKVVAKARVIPIDIREYATIHELVEAMQPGEVLVAETTEPAIILACQKASAIVTNQGGMMSHAAITAREMQIPCIVGTGNATKNIRTGDMIEVDADKGMVRILQTAMID